MLLLACDAPLAAAVSATADAADATDAVTLDLVETDADATAPPDITPACAEDCALHDNTCAYFTCDRGRCEPHARGSPNCDDGDPCTRGDMCRADGLCRGVLDCTDGNPETDDFCADGVCQNPTLETPRDLTSDPAHCGVEGRACPGASPEACAGGACVACSLEATAGVDLLNARLTCPGMPAGVLLRARLEDTRAQVPPGRAGLTLRWRTGSEAAVDCIPDERCETEARCGTPDGCRVMLQGAGTVDVELARERFAWSSDTHVLELIADGPPVALLPGSRLVVEVAR